jgi:hypothetical protein
LRTPISMQYWEPISGRERKRRDAFHREKVKNILQRQTEWRVQRFTDHLLTT